MGGDRRLAVSGLHRAYSLAYAGDASTGSQRDMARLRGVTSLSRTDLVQAISAVLEREPAAVARVEAELRDHRDRAAEALAFELARRIQDEIAAVQWLVSPQRVTAWNHTSSMSTAGTTALSCISLSATGGCRLGEKVR